MRKCFKLYCLLVKRLLQKPMFLILLLLIPIVSVAISTMEDNSKSETIIGLYFEDDYDNVVLEQIQNTSMVIRFVAYDNEDDLLVDVKKEDIDCGFVFEEDIREDVLKKKWKSKIDLYKHKNTMLDSVAKEIIVSAVFEDYSTQTYVDYVGSEIDEELVVVAKDLYEERLSDGSTFYIDYNGKQSEETKFAQENKNIKINLKGILALLIFIGGLNALLMNVEDVETKRFVTFCSKSQTTICNLLSQLSLLFLMTFFTLCFIDKGTSIMTNFVFLLLYVAIVFVYCYGLSYLLKTKETISMSIPIFSFLCLVCTPIIVDLSIYMGVFHIINKLLPTTYYLMLF